MKCPTCNGPMLTGTLDGEKGTFCPFCPPPSRPKERVRTDLRAEAKERKAPAELVELKLPGIDPGPAHNKIIIREDPFQIELKAALEKEGYEVLETTRRHKKAFCDPVKGGCGRWFWPRNPTGCDQGIPDLLVSHYDWAAYVWVGIEVKGTDTPLSEAQKGLSADHRILIARAEGSIDRSIRRVLDILAQIQRYVVDEEE